MNFTKTFEIDSAKASRIAAFFSGHGFKLETSSASSYRFKRGSGWATLYTFDVKNCPTRVDVTLSEGESNRLQIMVNCEVSGKGMQIFDSDDRQKIVAEMDAFEMFMKVK